MGWEQQQRISEQFRIR